MADIDSSSTLESFYDGKAWQTQMTIKYLELQFPMELATIRLTCRQPLGGGRIS
jgi:hypothetical protein